MVIGTRSRFSPKQRFKQTLKSIKSIRRFAPSCKICLFEASALPKKWERILKKRSDVYRNLSDNKRLFALSKSKLKGEGELYQTLHFLNIIEDLGKNVKFVFKLSGRYHLTPQFRLRDYIRVKTPLFAKYYSLKRKPVEGAICTVLYGIPSSSFGEWKEALQKMALVYEDFAPPNALPYFEKLLLNSLPSKTIIQRFGVRGKISSYAWMYIG